MTRAQILAKVRRLVNEGTANRFADSDIDTYMDQSWREVKEKITRVRPEEFIETWRTNIVASQGDYARLVANERALRILDILTNKYVAVEPLDWVKLQAWDTLNISNTTTPYRYAHFGQAYRIRPIPSSNITNGLEVEFLGLDSVIPTNGPECPLSLHWLVIHRSVILAFDESGESGGEAQGRAEAEWSKADEKVTAAYWDMQGEPMVLSGVR